MAIRNLRYNTDEILRKKSKNVEQYDNKIIELINDMFETMIKNEGAGLAAVQVGVLKRIIVIDVNKTKLALINPEIISSEGSQICEEGCLSLPNVFYNVERPLKMKVRGLDKNFKEIEIEAEGITAVVLSHEIDHLDGVLFTDKKIGEEIKCIK